MIIKGNIREIYYRIYKNITADFAVSEDAMRIQLINVWIYD